MPTTPTNPAQDSPAPPSAFILPPSAFLESLLDEVTAPNADLDAIAESHNLTRPDLAAILESPEAQPLLASLRNLYALHHEFQAYHHALTLAHTLCQAARAATNPTDKRLAATAALRALFPPSNRARSASERPSSSSSSSSPPPTGGRAFQPASPTLVHPTAPTSPTPRATPVPAVRPRDTPATHPRATFHPGPPPSLPGLRPPHPTQPRQPTPPQANGLPQPEPGAERPQAAPPRDVPHQSTQSPERAPQSASNHARLDRALSRRHPRIETLTRAGAPPDTS